MGEDLLSGSRALQSLIQDATDLPPVSRSIHQIAEQSERMLAAAGGPAAAPPPTAQTHRFLAKHGIEAMEMDPSAVELVRPPGAEQDPASSQRDIRSMDDLEDFLKTEHTQILHELVLETNQLIIDEFEAAFWDDDRGDWDNIKPTYLDTIRFEVGRYDTTASTSAPTSAPGSSAAPPAQMPSGTPAPHAIGRSVVRSARSVEFATALAPLWAARASEGGGGGGGSAELPFDLVAAWGGVACSERQANAESKLSNCWQLLTAMSAAVREAARLPSQKNAWGHGLVPSSEGALRTAMLRGAISHLGAQQRRLLEQSIGEQREIARRGGLAGTEFDAAARIALEAAMPQSSAGSAPQTNAQQVAIGGGKHAPLWPAVYWCLRCGDAAAAVRVMRSAVDSGIGLPDEWNALLALAAACAAPSLGGAPASSSSSSGAAAVEVDVAQLISDARAEYWRTGAADTPWLSAVYSVLAAPEPQAKLEELLPPREMTIEDWLWHRLSMIYVQMRELPPPEPVSLAPLHGLQSLLYDRLGEAHFNKGGGSPLLFFSTLLHSLQLERALAFLSTYPQYADEAIHIGLAAHHAGMLNIANEPPSHATDGQMITQIDGVRRLLLTNMLSRYVSGWAHEDGVTALQYLFLLRNTPIVTETIAVSVLLDAGATEVLLPRLPFLNLSTQRRLMTSCAERLHSERYASNAAARLLFEAQAYEPLCSLLLELLSTALLTSPHANPTLAAAPAPSAPTASEPTNEANLAQLRADAAAFLAQWRAAEPVAADGESGAALTTMLAAAEFLYTCATWRRQRANRSNEEALTAALTQLDALPLLPATPSRVDTAHADLRVQPQPLQLLAPPLVSSAMEAAHAKFVSLRRGGGAAAAPDGATGVAAELRALRERGEALVAFAAISNYASPMASGAQMPQPASQQLATWLSDMA